MATMNDEAARAATGRDLASWFDWLHDHDAEALDHRQIVRLLSNDGEVLSGWWCQEVTSQFEQHIGRRRPGMTEDGTFEVGVERAFRSSPSRVWALLASEAGAAAWLGEPPSPWWRGNDGGPEVGDELVGTSGERFEVLEFLDDEAIRLRARGPALPESVLELRLQADRGRSTVVLRQDGFRQGELREDMREHWTRALERIAELLDED
ncbi:MAG: hypothetical protein JWM86_1710 [Thermoleophilia bacterium]|nr:hypothetical protein [Thermoleophilia bacterium]